MANLYIITGVCLVFVAAIIHGSSGAKVCGLEKLKPCDSRNKTCILKSLGPQLLQWFKNGKPEYFLDDVDYLSYDNIDIPVSDGVYYLNSVVISGAGNSEVSDYNFEVINKNEGLTNYTYIFKLEVNAKSFHKVDENKEKITCERPLALKLDDIEIKTMVPVNFVKRCDGSQFMVFNAETFSLEGYPSNCVKYEINAPIRCDLKEFNRGLINIVSELVFRSINNNYRMLYKLIDVNEFLIVKR